MMIQIDPHTTERAEEWGPDSSGRGATPEEIEDVIRTGFPVAAKHGREGRAKIYDFGRQRLGKTYKQKRVEVFYAVERDVIITATVYVFYGEWEP
jgi:hypothetical protein